MRSFFLKSFAPLAFGSVLAAALPAFASTPQTPAASAPSRGENSGTFIDYRPSAAEYSPALKAIVEPLTQACAAIKPESAAPLSKDTQRLLEESISRNIAFQSQSTRGLRDELNFLLGYAYEKLGQNDEALKAYERSIEERSGNPLALFRHAVVLARLGHCDTAVPEFDETLWKTQQAKAEILYAKADCLATLTRIDEANTVLTAARAANPNFIPAIRLSVMLKAPSLQGKNPTLEAQVLPDLRLVAQNRPNDRDIQLLLAKVLLRRSNPLLGLDGANEAETIARRYAESSHYADDTAVRIIADSQLLHGDMNAAEATLKLGLEKNPASPLLASAMHQLMVQRAADQTAASAASAASSSSSPASNTPAPGN